MEYIIAIAALVLAIIAQTRINSLKEENKSVLEESFKVIAPVLAILALINIVYTAFVAYAQTDIKRIVAYSSISNKSGLVSGSPPPRQIKKVPYLFISSNNLNISLVVNSCAFISPESSVSPK